MGNIHLLTGAVSSTGTLTRGSWETDYPVTNILNSLPGRVARTTDALVASTRFTLDLGSAQSMQMFAFVNHNFTEASEIRIRVSDDSGGAAPSLDETLIVEKGTIDWGTLPWGVFPWSGVPETFPGGFTTFYLHDTVVSGRYILIDATDTDNADGYWEFGSFLADVPFVPDINAAPGVEIGVVDNSRIDRAVGAGIYALEKPVRRRVSGSLAYLTEAEALGDIYSLQRNVGRGKGVLFVLDPEEANEMLMRRTVYGSLTSLGALNNHSSVDAPWSWTFTLEELL